MSFPPGSTAFFDIWTTLAFVELSADGEHLVTFTVYPHVIKILRELAGEGVRLGVLSDRGRIPEDEMRYALRTSGLAPLYDQMVVVFGRTTAPGTFTRTTARIREVEGCGGARLVYVSNELPATTNAGRFGFLTAPDPRLALSRLQEGGRLRYLRIGAPARLEKHWPAVLCNQPLAPVHIMAGDSDDEPSAIIAVADERTADALESEGFQVQRLGFPDEPQTNGLYSLQGGLKPGDELAGSNGLAARELISTSRESLLTVPSGQRVFASRPAGSGESPLRKLTPLVALLGGGNTMTERTTPLPAAACQDPLSPCEHEILARHFCPTFMQTTVARYAGTDPGATGIRIASRHVDNPGNQYAVEELAAELDEIAPGRLQVRRHCFIHEHHTLANVVATLPASGMEGQGIVVVGAHLDSIGVVQDHGKLYCSTKDSAPGADDDASGMAGVLAAARAFVELAALAGRQHREVRFAFFNAEEKDGRPGSDAYARAQAALGTRAEAVFHMDMIGYDSTAPSRFEVHAGMSNPEAPNAAAVQKRSIELAQLVAELRPVVSCQLREELFRTQDDPARTRSDHASFHLAGYPACLVSEDSFPDGNESADFNPNYHSWQDRAINAEYAAQIARLVGAAAWIAATR